MVYDLDRVIGFPGETLYGPAERDERASGGQAEGRPYLFSEESPHEKVRRLRITYGSTADAIVDQALTRETGALVRGNWLRYFHGEGKETSWLLDRAPAPHSLSL